MNNAKKNAAGEAFEGVLMGKQIVRTCLLDVCIEYGALTNWMLRQTYTTNLCMLEVLTGLSFCNMLFQMFCLQCMKNKTTKPMLDKID